MHYRSLQAKLPSDLLLLMTLKHPATWFWFQKHQVHSTAIRHPITPTTPSACLQPRSRHSATGRQSLQETTFGQITLISKKLTETLSADPFNITGNPNFRPSIANPFKHHRITHNGHPTPSIPTAPRSQPFSRIHPTAAAVSAPAGAFSIFLHCRSSDCSRRSAICISPLPQQWLLPQERYLYFPLPQQWLLPQERYLYFPTAAAVTAPAGALSVFPTVASSVCSRRSAICISPLPQ